MLSPNTLKQSMRKPKQPIAYYIEWCDAYDRGSTWENIEEALVDSKTNNWIVREVGFILAETKEYIVISPRLADGDKLASNILKIPKTWVLKRVKLKL